MRFLLFRHAHKGIIPFENPELSPQGLDQAAKISEMVQLNKLTRPTHLYVSPKKRTGQTFLPLSQKLNIKVEIQADLDQRNFNETQGDFRKRIQNFLRQLESQPKGDSVIFACTHYDWIEESMSLINSDKDLNNFEFSHWSPTQFVEFELHDGLWKYLRKGSAL